MATSSIHKDLLSRIEQCQARVGVIGLGYVGLPLAHALHGGGLPRRIHADAAIEAVRGGYHLQAALGRLAQPTAAA